MVDRIILILKTQDLSSSQFADEIGVQRSSISHILSGRNNASLEFVTKILKRFPDLNSDWLIFGKGPMYRDSNNAVSDKSYSSLQSDEPDLFSMPVEEELPDIIPQEVEEEELESKIEEPTITPHTVDISSQNKNETLYDAVEKEKDLVSEDKVTENKEEIKPETVNKKAIEKIVIFYSDRTFREYFPD
ncbi:MAG: helix-turn-helix transcriptional regulator [Bacteroidota bacterium]